MSFEDYKSYFLSQYDLIRAELRAKNVYSRKQSDHILRLLSQVEYEIASIAAEYRKSYAEVLREFDILDPEALLEEGMRHWDEKLKAETVPPDPELLQLLRSFGLRVKKVCRVFIPTDEQDVPDGDGGKFEGREHIDHNRVIHAVQTLLGLEINGTKLQLDDIQIQLSNSPEHGWRERAYWCISIPNLRVAILLNNQYGNRTFVVKYIDGRELASITNMKKSDLKELADSLPAKIHHFEYTDEGDFKGKLATVVLGVLEGQEQPRFYATYQEAKEAAQNLRIKNKKEYEKRYKEDTKLPADPCRFYKTKWISWYDFLRNEAAPEFYSTFTEAKEATQNLYIQSQIEYRKRYKQDTKLPAAPDRFYKTEWTSWPDFLRNETAPEFYSTFTKAKEAVQTLGITREKEY